MERINKDYAVLGLQALKRAAQKVAETAKRDSIKIPIWRDGRIEYIIPEIETEQGAPPDRYSAGAP